VLEILGAEHGRHAAATDLTLDRVAVGEPGTTSRKEVEEHRREKNNGPA